MEKFNIDYSTKNIPIPSEREYMIQLISKVEKFFKRMRQKALQFLGKQDNSGKENHGFKTRKCPPCVDELVDFKNDMMKMMKNIEFRNIKCTFQTKLMSDIKKINESNKLLIPADKSRNIYIMQKNDYNKYVSDNVTKTYKRTTTNRVANINYKSKLLAEKLAVDDRIEIMEETEAYITVKDHKECFPTNCHSV